MKDIDLNKLSREELIAYCKEKIVNFSNVDLNNKDLSEEEKVNLFKQQIDIIFHLTDVIEKDDVEIRELNLNINKLIKQIDNKDYKLARQLSDRFAPKTEKSEYIVNEVEKVIEEENKEKEVKKVGRKKGVQNHDDIDLSKVKVIDEYLSVAEDKCSCNHTLIEGKEEIINKFEYTPASFVLRRIHLKNKRCEFCNKKYSSDSKLDIFNRSSLTPSLASNIAAYKYQYGLPLYRIEKIFSSDGVNISRQSLASYMIRLAEELESVYNKLKEKLLNNRVKVIHADETTLKVIDTKERINSYMFVYTSSYYDYPIAIYEYQIDRGSAHIKKFFNNYSGYIVCDAYSGYNVIDENKRAYCYFHAREKFARIIKTLPQNKRECSKANQIIQILEKAFNKEKTYIKDKLTPEEIKKKRKEEIEPIINKYFDTLKQLQGESSDPLYSAINYSLKNEVGLRLFLTNPYIPMTNNAAERAVKSFVIDRKNFLFSYSSIGAKASGIIMSLIQSAKLNLLQPNKYIEYLLNNINKVKESEIDKLLPFNPALPKEIYQDDLKKD